MSKSPLPPSRKVLLGFGGLLSVLTVLAVGYLIGSSGRAAPGDWFRFAGAAVGAAFSVLASVTVLEWQRTRETRAQEQLLRELLADVERECEPFQVANETALKNEYGRSVREQVRHLSSAISRVHKFREELKPQTAKMMRVSDALSDLSYADGETERWLTSVAFYPDSADLGGFNAKAHEVLGIVEEARRLL